MSYTMNMKKLLILIMFCVGCGVQNPPAPLQLNEFSTTYQEALRVALEITQLKQRDDIAVYQLSKADLNGYCAQVETNCVIDYDIYIQENVEIQSQCFLIAENMIEILFAQNEQSPVNVGSVYDKDYCRNHLKIVY